MMTFYIGQEIKRYEKKWSELAIYFSRQAEQDGIHLNSKAAVFRYVIDKLHSELHTRKKSKKEG